MNDLNWLEVGNRIQERRLAKKLTQQKLAEMTELSDVYIGYIEQGKRRTSIEALLRIANALGCTVDDLLTGKNPPKEIPQTVESLVEGCNAREKNAILLAIQGIIDMVYELHTG